VNTIETVQAIYAAMHDKDLERLVELVDPTIVVTQDDRLPWGGRFEGHDGFGEFAMKLIGTITSEVRIDDIFEADGDVLQVGHTQGTVNATGVEFDIAEVHRWTIVDGRAVRAHMSIDTPGMLRALAQS
jgi:ketosteroid isomerase-like protein